MKHDNLENNLYSAVVHQAGDNPIINEQSTTVTICDEAGGDLVLLTDSEGTTFMKQKKPDHCAGCTHYHRAGHPKGSRLHGSMFDNWCVKYSTAAPKAVSVCLIQGGKDLKWTGLT